MSATAKLGIDSLETTPPGARSRTSLWERPITLPAPTIRRILVLLMLGAIGGADYASGPEISLSLLYLLPVVCATWFIDVRTGLLAAAVGATISFIIEVELSALHIHPWSPLWNAGFRLIFFVTGVGVVALLASTAARLRRDVRLRTQILQQESARRQCLEREMLEMSAHEQARIAHDLHDGLGQYLAALAFHARILSDDLHQQASPLASHAERLIAIIRRTNQITRQLDRALRVPQASEGGLIAALRTLAAEFEQLTDVHCDFQATEPELRLDELRTLMLFRIAQEAFSNAVKHAQPRLIRLTLAQADQVLTLRIFDDGQGIAAEVAPELGTGLRIMKLRAELIGARLAAGPKTGGYEVECVVPLSVADSAGIPAAKFP